MTANLANFSYDPLNFPYLTEAKAVDLFLQLLASPNEKLILHGIAGLCNLCLGNLYGCVKTKTHFVTFHGHNFLLIKIECVNIISDSTSFDTILNHGGIETISALLHHDSNKIVENSISTLIQLDRVDTHSHIFATSNVARIVALKQSPHPIIRNLANLFLANRQDAVSSECTTQCTNTG